jgi:hypothetical protein
LGEELQEMADAERDKFENLSEGLQESDRGQSISDAADNLEEAASACSNGNADDALSALGNFEV